MDLRALLLAQTRGDTRSENANPQPEFSARCVPNPDEDENPTDAKYCWVCYAGEEDDEALSPWVKPCKCKGTTKWVHQHCLQRWVDEKRRGDWFKTVQCPLCMQNYVIFLPQPNKLMMVLEVVDSVIYRMCPFIVAGAVMTSLYWLAVTYGGVTIIQVMGSEGGVALLDSADPVFIIVGLPVIPVVLLLTKLIRWDDFLLRFLRYQVSSKPCLGYILPSFRPVADIQQNTEFQPSVEPISTTRLFCGALFLPTAATLCGKLLFESVNSKVQRTLLGGLVFLGVKGIIKLYYKQQQYIRQRNRQILDYPEEDRQQEQQQN